MTSETGFRNCWIQRRMKRSAGSRRVTVTPHCGLGQHKMWTSKTRMLPVSGTVMLPSHPFLHPLPQRLGRGREREKSLMSHQCSTLLVTESPLAWAEVYMFAWHHIFSIEFRKGCVVKKTELEVTEAQISSLFLAASSSGHQSYKGDDLSVVTGGDIWLVVVVILIDDLPLVNVHFNGCNWWGQLNPCLVSFNSFHTCPVLHSIRYQ